LLRRVGGGAAGLLEGGVERGLRLGAQLAAQHVDGQFLRRRLGDERRKAGAAVVAARQQGVDGRASLDGIVRQGGDLRQFRDERLRLGDVFRQRRRVAQRLGQRRAAAVAGGDQQRVLLPLVRRLGERKPVRRERQGRLKSHAVVVRGKMRFDRRPKGI